ncbi:MAG: tRNA (guanosine(46)-N7)-methyltransferase TrmB [Mycobacterium sp.]|jgi:tRNA (guanine-N7-)-methyltransferase|nr:tRNA (guanosine(46)-N7)-methyltransferase TrmB [Mycobacterium sp.]
MSDDERMHAQRQVGPTTPDSDAAPHSYRRVTSFRSRRASLTEQQQEVWDRLWPSLGTLARPAGTGSDAAPAEPLDTAAWFGRRAPVVLEIGCGTGTSTLAMAQAEPDIDVVAVEVYRRGLAQLLSAIDREGVTNIRLVRGDGVDVLERMFTTATLTGVRVFFPDPWPKSRHHKRRLLQARTVGLIADRLVPGGLLHAATDHAGYAEHIAAVGDAETRLRRVPATEALPISVHRPITKYETKARHAGSEVTELLWVRRP